jgi:cytochrome c oxidase cbb3-type subunit III
MSSRLRLLLGAVLFASTATRVAVTAPVWAAQNQAPAGRGRVGAPAQPAAPQADPAILERGRGLYSVNCASCHGSEARGGETGPNLLRSAVILNDTTGADLVALVRVGRAERGMPPRLDLTDEQIRTIGEFLKTLRTTGRDPGRNRPATIVVGEASAGQAYFAAKCATCHSATGDLKGLASKYPDPRQLQQVWLAGTAAGGRGAPAGARPSPIRITVTLPSGEKVEGVQARLDDFIVSLTMADGSTRTFARRGDVPKLEIRDPLQAHRSLVPTYRDKDVHDVTAYLVTLK